MKTLKWEFVGEKIEITLNGETLVYGEIDNVYQEAHLAMKLVKKALEIAGHTVTVIDPRPEISREA